VVFAVEQMLVAIDLAVGQIAVFVAVEQIVVAVAVEKFSVVAVEQIVAVVHSEIVFEEKAFVALAVMQLADVVAVGKIVVVLI